MSKELTYPGDHKDYRLEEMQLIMSLKFHHSETLGDIPLEVALSAMSRVWMSCQKDVDQAKPTQSKDTFIK